MVEPTAQSICLCFAVKMFLIYGCIYMKSNKILLKREKIRKSRLIESFQTYGLKAGSRDLINYLIKEN